jgi:CheY-like chemotaxis protein
VNWEWPPVCATQATAVEKVVLIVEDEFWTRYTASEYFRLMGYGVLAAQSADEAIALLQSGKRIDVVFSDVKMPGSSMDGLELAKWLSQQFPNIPVLLTSGTELKHLPYTVRAFFRKPYSLANVERGIRGMV